MKLFEQLRKNITLNKSMSKKESKEKGDMLRDIRKDFYDGLINDLMANKSFELSEIVMAEKLKEKFVQTVNDELIGLNIYAAQLKFPEFRQKFELLIDSESQFEFTSHISNQLGSTLMKFDSDELKHDRLALTERITRKMRDNQIQYDGNLFHNIVYVFTESQQWQDIASLLRS